MKALMKELVKTVRQSIPEIAKVLETVRDNLILIQYQIMVNHAQLSGIWDFKKQKKPLLEKLKKVRAGIREKTAERKKLRMEKENLSVWEVVKQLKYSQQITTITEDIEELKSRKTQIMEELGCENDTAVKTVEATVANLDKRKENLEKVQKALETEKSKNREQYAETLYSIAPKDLSAVEAERIMLRHDGRIELMQKLREKFGERFNRRQFDMIEKEVEDKLPVRKMPQEQKSIHERLQERKQEQVNKKQTNRKQDLSL